MDGRQSGNENHCAKRRVSLPRFYRAQKPGKSSLTHSLIRQSKDQYVLPTVRPAWPRGVLSPSFGVLAANGQQTSYNRLIAYLAKAGIGNFTA